MHPSNLIKVCQKLDKKDLTALKKFVRSPFFNQREDVIRLFDYIISVIRKSNTKLLAKAKAFDTVFPNRAYDDSQMRYTMSFLLKVIESYLTYTEMTKDRFNSSLHLSRALRLRGMNDLFEKEWKNLQQLQDKRSNRNTQFHYQNYLVYLERYEYIHLQKRSGEMNLQELSNELTTFYIADLLRQNCSILTHQSMSTQNYELKMLEPVLQEVAKGDYTSIPAVSIYYHAYLALSYLENETHFQELKKLIHVNWKKFPPTEIRDIYLLAINYCIKRLNRGNRQYIREAFELYRTALDHQVLLEHGFLSSFTYNNIHSLGFALNELEWIEHFLETYKAHLYPKDRDNTYRYNRAVFHFRQAEYTEAMSLLQQVEFKDVLYNSDARSMLLRIYYERQEFDALDSLLESFKTYIHRNKNIGYHGENYLTLIYFVKKILKNNIKDKNFRQELIQEIVETKVLAEREWLLEQLGE